MCHAYKHSLCISESLLFYHRSNAYRCLRMGSVSSKTALIKSERFSTSASRTHLFPCHFSHSPQKLRRFLFKNHNTARNKNNIVGLIPCPWAHPVFFITETSKQPLIYRWETSTPRSVGSSTRVQTWVLDSCLPAPPLLHMHFLCMSPACWFQNSTGPGWWQTQEHPRSYLALGCCCGTPEQDPSVTVTHSGAALHRSIPARSTISHQA